MKKEWCRRSEGSDCGGFLKRFGRRLQSSDVVVSPGGSTRYEFRYWARTYHGGNEIAMNLRLMIIKLSTSLQPSKPPMAHLYSSINNPWPWNFINQPSSAFSINI